MRRIVLLLPLVAVLSSCIDTPRTSRRDPPPRRPAQAVAPKPDQRQCLAELGVTQAAFTPLPDKHFGGGCSTVGTVRLASLRSDTTYMSVANTGPVTCNLAKQVAGWARFGVDRAAQQILGSGLARIETFGTYSCRTVAGTSRLSGHATANAIDISAFVLQDGRRISVLNHWSGGTEAERRFLRTVHASACKRFGTTLGPAYNAAHKDHLHLEADGANFCR